MFDPLTREQRAAAHSPRRSTRRVMALGGAILTLACSFPDYQTLPAALSEAGTSGVGGTSAVGAASGASGVSGTSNGGGAGASGAPVAGGAAVGGSSSVPTPCSPNPCVNDGRCFASGNEYACVCPQGFQGKNCDLKLSFCAPNPCLNGGVCIDSLTAATCECAVGFSGDRCQSNDDDCTPNPCQNGGTCTDAVNAYSCACLPGFQGDVCSGAVMESCAAILAAQPGASSGVYTVDPDGMNQGKSPLPVYCDMTTDGGGYTRVGHEDVGASGTYKFLGLEAGSALDVANATGNGFFGP
ncbi:MAG TPA: fibrinogen-like YCDxxxxGGGW domain-containing protein, partial [Polyangiaceae bacterium]|nr:fibrinogen-like YCDxxxxGGGW domain-containing protein [Polyangiaceae bacterium]